MTTRREREEALLEDMLHYQRDHRALLVRLVELDTFQEVDATADQPSLLELALRQLNRSIPPSPEMKPFLLALLARTHQPFQSSSPLGVAQQALLAQQDALFAALLDHPAAPERAVWHAARWTPAKRTHPSDWTWPVALARLLPTKVHPSLSRLFQEGWPPEAHTPGLSWLSHARAIHLPLARQWGHHPTDLDRALWGQRFAQADLTQTDQDQFIAAWGQATSQEIIPALPSQDPGEVLIRLLKGGPTPTLQAQLDALSTPEQPWTEIAIKDRGPHNKQTTWSPIGWILLQVLRIDPSDWRAHGRSWDAWDRAMALEKRVVAAREATAGVTEGGLCQLLGKGKDMAQGTSLEQMVEWGIAATEAFFCRGAFGHMEAPALPGAAARKVEHVWRRLEEHRYTRAPSATPAQWLNWWGRLFALGLGVPEVNYGQNNKHQEALVRTLVRLCQSADLPATSRQGLLLGALATARFAPEPAKRIVACFMGLAASGYALAPNDPAVLGCLSLASKSPWAEEFVVYLTSQQRHVELAQRPVVPITRPRRRS